MYVILRYKPIPGRNRIMGTYIGMDFGGTKLLVGEVSCDGQILSKKKYTTGYVNQECAVDIIKSSLGDFMRTECGAEREPSAVGIGLIGRVDTTSGEWLQIDPQRSQTVKLGSIVRATFGMPCYVANDVKSATLAEQCWGHGRHSDDFIYINIGTGIAAGFVVGGRLILGSHFNAGEVGHTQVGVQTGVKCCCGRTDCVEAIAAGIGFDSCARLLYPSYPDTLLHLPESSCSRVDVHDIYALAQRGDSLCKLLVDNAAQAIANLIMNLVRVSDPEMVVLGGGIVSAPEMYDNIMSRLHPGTMRFVSKGVVLTCLNPSYAGLLGAAAVAMTQDVNKSVTV